MTMLRRDRPISPAEARAAATAVLDLPGADQVEVAVSASDTALTRYARSEIIQNTVRGELRATVRVVAGERVAVASTNQLDAQSMAIAGNKALEAARATPPDEGFPGLAAPERVGRADGVFRYSNDTAGASPGHRAAAITEILSITGSAEAAGIFETSAHCYGIINSLGIDCWDAFTRCVTTCLVDDDGGTGWAEASSHDLTEVDVEAAARTAADKAARNREPAETDAGPYEVVLEPAAAAMLLDYLAYMGVGAKQVIDGESFLSSRTGEIVATEDITIADDAFHPLSVGIGFDFEGVPKKSVAVIDRGRAVGPVTDLRTANALGLSSSGHASGSNEFGPYAFNTVLRPGTAEPDELIAGVADGILITRFHYVNVLDRPTTLLTGMTRDGTFRIRDGEIAEPVRNFRFSQSVLDALSSTLGVGNDLTAFAPDYGSFGSNVAPSLRIGEFNFASVTSH